MVCALLPAGKAKAAENSKYAMTLILDNLASDGVYGDAIRQMGSIYYAVAGGSNNVSAWTERYQSYLRNGLNLVPQYIGNSVGSLQYEFLESYEAVAENWFGLGDNTFSYLRIAAPGDLGGSHLGFEIYRCSEGDKTWHRVDRGDDG